MKINNKSWTKALEDEFGKEYFKNLNEFLEKEYKEKTVYPKKEDIFKVFELLSIEDVKVVILGQDPYHNENEAMGIAFSVPKFVKVPPSLKNMYKELEDDLGICNTSGCLVSWLLQGVFLLNTVLSVRKNEPGSHQNKGWEIFCEKVLSILDKEEKKKVFVLLGNSAKKYKKCLKNKKHSIIEGVHPSPLSAYRGFFGSKIFSRINEVLRQSGEEEINWQIDEE